MDYKTEACMTNVYNRKMFTLSELSGNDRSNFVRLVINQSRVILVLIWIGGIRKTTDRNFIMKTKHEKNVTVYDSIINYVYLNDSY